MSLSLFPRGQEGAGFGSGALATTGWEWEGGACVGPVPPGCKLVLHSSPGVP